LKAVEETPTAAAASGMERARRVWRSSGVRTTGGGLLSAASAGCLRRGKMTGLASCWGWRKELGRLEMAEVRVEQWAPKSNVWLSNGNGMWD
jgi:hypothetical protein